MEPTLQDMPSTENICFLLGAGASVRAGIPPMKEMGQQLRAVVQKNSPELGLIMDTVPHSPSFATWNESNNIEALLFYLYASAAPVARPDKADERREGFFDGESASTRLQERQKRARLSAILALQACGFILDRTSHHNNQLSYLDGLKLLLQPGATLDIFSLNYDTVIEDFCSQNQIHCVDGFDAKGDWRPSLFFRRANRSALVETVEASRFRNVD